MAKRTKTSQSQQIKDIKAAADKAEARSAKAPKAETTKVAAKADRNEDQDRALFLDYLPKIAKLKKLIADTTNTLRTNYKQAKSDGILKSDFDAAFAMQGHEGEKVKKAAILRDLKVARWLGLDLGAQLDLFAQDERVPAADRSFEEGKTQAMQGISLKCDYAPETEQFRRFAEGWHEGQAVLSKGFKKLHPAVAEDEKSKIIKKAKDDAEKAEDAKAFDAPASGVPMTRAQYNKEQQAQKPN